MIKTKLPVMVLRNIVLFPHGEIRLEISLDEDKSIIEKSINNHDNYLFMISPEQIYDEFYEEDLPTIGTIGKITSNFELPNGNLRISVVGVNRARIFEYIDEDEKISDVIIGPVKLESIQDVTEQAKLRVLKKKFSDFVLAMPNISDNIIVRSNEEKSLDRLTDMIINMIPLSFEDKIKFLYEINTVKRCDKLLDVLTREREISNLERNLENELKIELDKAQKEYILREKIKVIKDELGDNDEKEIEINDLKEKVEKLNANKIIKEKILKEIKKYESLPPMSPEIGIVKNYIDLMINMPWNINSKDNYNLKDIEDKLNKTHYGLDDVKNRIIEYVAVKKISKNNRSPIICLVGPPGVGKTSLAFSIAKALNKKFVKISVGGVSDEAEIIGHRRTYIGAAPGRIINGIKKAKTNNPLFLIDEIDKMTKDIKGDPASALLEVLDPEQNKLFTDNYIEEAFDLSKVMFILTANDIDKIPYALRDRLEIITLSSYTEYEKIDIVKKYMFDKLLKENGLKKEDISIDDETLKYIIENYTKESGIRELERVISSIMRKVAKKMVSSNEKTCSIITKDNLHEYLGMEKYDHIIYNDVTDYGIVNGLGYTPFGGEIIPLEVSLYEGKGNIILTGSLGDVMKESAKIALGFIKSHAKEYNIDIKKLSNLDIHINAVEGAVPKDGPSAGTALTTTMISALKQQKVDKTVALTGEITLKGIVLKIGGLREKAIGAYNQGIKEIIIPKTNKNDLEKLPKEVREKINFILVEKYDEIYNLLFK